MLVIHKRFFGDSQERDQKGGRLGEDPGTGCSEAGAARRRASGDGPAFAKASAVACKTLADQPAGKHSCPHAEEVITFSPREKTDWGKKRGFFEDCFVMGGKGRTGRILGDGMD
jgi:hypothetical protein